MNYSNTAVDTFWAASITDSEQSKAVDSATGYPEAPFKIQCQEEVILVDTKSGTTFSDMTRGFEGTTAAAHGTNDKVKHVGTSGDLEAIPYGTWLSDLFRRPSSETGHTDDDEFDDATVTGWTQVTPTGTNTLTEGKGRLSMHPASNAGNDMCGVIKAFGGATTHPLTVETAVVGWGQVANYIMHGLVFSDGTATSSNCVVSMPYNSGSNWTNSFRHGTFANINTDFGGAITIHANMLMYQRLIWSAANTFKYQYSNDGLTWYDHTASGAKTMTPTHYGMAASTWGGGTSHYATFEYFRVTESDLSL